MKIELKLLVQDYVYKSSRGVFLLLLLSLFCSQFAYAQLSITSTTAVTENFDGLGSSSSATLPSGFRVTNGSTTAYSSGTTVVTAAAGTSGTGALTGSSAGGVYNFGNGVTASATQVLVPGM
ncbi:MAG: hypothetical protein EBZ77_13535 [Chitinophagia bacterium]|nr:hypothetical protein [Chitinophagia bacterium]